MSGIGSGGGLQNLLQPTWYDSPEKKGIICFYPGSAPVLPWGYLYDTITNAQHPFYGWISIERYQGQGY
jgi:hypothetical protein